MKIPVKIFLLLYFLFLSCEKSELKSILETRKGYLTGIGNSTTNWKLKGITIDGLPQQLSGSQLSYTKQYFSSLKFSDTDGSTGNWSIPVADSLKEVFNNYPSGIIVKQNYYISFLSYDSLSLIYLLNGKVTNVKFKALR